MSNSIDKLLLDVIKGIVYESHDEHVDYEGAERDEVRRQSGGRAQSSGGGQSALPMLLVGVAFAAVGYMLGKRSGSSGKTGDTSIDIQEATNKAADRTQEMAENTAEKIREGGQGLSEQTETKAQQASERIEEKSEEVGDQIEERGSEAADEMEDSG